jgi:hypothetical protein
MEEETTPTQYLRDHDILIELRTQVRDMRTDIRDMKDGLTAKVNELDMRKADKNELNSVQVAFNALIAGQSAITQDHEKRVRDMEKTLNEAEGKTKTTVRLWTVGMGIISIILTIIIAVATN